MMRRLVLAATCATTLLVAAAPAHAADDPANPPFRLGGLLVTGPSAPQFEVVVTAKIAVRVRRAPGVKGRPRALITYNRITKSGRILKHVDRHALRSGSYSVKVPQAGPATYRLTVSVGKARRSFDMTVMPGVDECGPARRASTGTVRLRQPTVAAGQPLSLSVQNTSDNCLLLGGVKLEWQRQEAQGWVPAFTGPDTQLLVTPHDTLASKGLIVPASLPAGHYRITLRLPAVNWALKQDTKRGLLTTVELDVTAAAA
jgi:hypothetical protein